VELVRFCDAPCTLTLMGLGAFPASDPRFLGMLGMHGTLEANLAMHEADLVVCVGARFDDRVTGRLDGFCPQARFVHIDVDPTEIGRNYEAVRLAGDAAETISALRSALARRDLSYRASQRDKMTARIAGFWRAFDTERESVAGSENSPIRPERVMSDLQQVLTAETTVVADASYSSMWIAGQLRALSSGMRFLSPRGLAGLGWGLPLALGAKAARPDEPVVAIVGDGGFAHSWAELETMVRSKLPVLIIVLNNGILGFQRDAETVKFGSFTTACSFADVDHRQIAEACGCPAVRISDPADLPRCLERGLREEGPLLIEVITDADAHPPISLFAALDQAA